MSELEEKAEVPYGYSVYLYNMGVHIPPTLQPIRLLKVMSAFTTNLSCPKLGNRSIHIDMLDFTFI